MKWLTPLLMALMWTDDPFDDGYTALALLSAGVANDDPAERAVAWDGRGFDGVPASPGVATGTARVLLAPADMRAARPGEVLVVRALLPLYTPLLAHASAVVAERGGALAAGAAVARDGRVPAVLGVRDATLLIRSGDRVRVDGTTGRVDLLP